MAVSDEVMAVARRTVASDHELQSRLIGRVIDTLRAHGWAHETAAIELLREQCESWRVLAGEAERAYDQLSAELKGARPCH